MHDKDRFPKVIYGINWGLRTFDPRQPDEEEIIPEQKQEPPPLKDPKKPKKEVDAFEVLPEEPMIEGYSDYRQILQRNGLFVYNWAVWKEHGLIVVNWIRSYGQMKQYASEFCTEQDLATITPTRTGNSYYWTKYNGEEPDYIIYAAPEDIRYDSHKRSAYLTKLRAAGVTVNLDYEFTLTKQKYKVGETPRYISASERYVNMVRRALYYPETFQDQIEEFISAICADGTLDRWKQGVSDRSESRNLDKLTVTV